MANIRSSNFELLRICCMMMIVAGHIVLYHKTTYAIDGTDEIIKLFCMSFFSMAVNTFVLISGYFGIHFKKERFIQLIIQTFAYSVILLIVSVVIGWHNFNLKKDIFAFLPILTKQYWFVTCYVVLYVISPWLNRWISSLDTKDYKRFLMLGFAIIYVWPTFSFLFNTSQFIGDCGYGIINFCYLYMLGRFLNLHYDDRHSSIQYFWSFFLAGMILFLCQYSLSWILGFEFTSWISYNTVFILVGSVCLLLAFKNMKFSSSKINYWAKPCLAVYLIHMSPYIWDGFCNAIDIPGFHGYNFILLVLLLPIVVYIVCASIEICRGIIMRPLEKTLVSIFDSSDKQ